VHGRGRHRRAARCSRSQAARRPRRVRLARTGSSYSNGSGEFAIAFSTAADLRTTFRIEHAPQPRTLLPTDGVSPLFQAALEATEEAVYNSLLKATPVTSRFGKAEALPIERVREILRVTPNQ
jgi:D-aminopeptidase